MGKLKMNAAGTKRVGRNGNPNKKRGRPKKADTVVKAASRSGDEIRAAAAQQRQEALDYAQDVGALPGQRLVVKQRDGFKLRWVKDDDKGGIDRARRLGYYFVQENQNGEFVPTDDLGSRVSIRSGVKEGGGPEFSYLMETPEETYQEDQQAKESRIRATEAQIHGGDGSGGGLAASGSAYNPNPRNNALKGLPNG